MSDFSGFKCDVCGKIIQTGIRISGEKSAPIVYGIMGHEYRIDFCDDCFNRMMEFCNATSSKDKNKKG